MTHIFETTSGDYNLINSGEKRFDVLAFGRTISIGDVIIYQRLADRDEEETKDGEVNDTPFSDDECSVIVSFIFQDEEKAIKKGFTAVGFVAPQVHQN